MDSTKTTNTLLLIIAIPIVFFILQTLSFIFIPLIFAMILAILFLPLMRWMNKKNINKIFSISLIVLLFVIILKVGGELIQLVSQEIFSVDDQFIHDAELKLLGIAKSVEAFLGVERLSDQSLSNYYLKGAMSDNIMPTLDFIRSALTTTLTTLFFAILLLAESINFQKILNTTLFKHKFSSIKTFMSIEKEIHRFIKVKIFVSFLTGVGFSLVCLAFDIKFPLFWGMLAFLVNFIQFVGSIVSTIAASLFGLILMEPGSMFLFYALSLTAVQVLVGGVLEPVLLGKTFSINVVTVLIMLMLWGFIWGIPGMIIALPVTVFLKILFLQFPKTKQIAQLMGTNTKY